MSSLGLGELRLNTIYDRIVFTLKVAFKIIIVDHSICFLTSNSPDQVLESADAGDEKAITAMGLLNTMETILAVMEEKPEVHQALEPVILQVESNNKCNLDVDQLKIQHPCEPYEFLSIYLFAGDPPHLHQLHHGVLRGGNVPLL